jgi:hypothetical protein
VLDGKRRELLSRPQRATVAMPATRSPRCARSRPRPSGSNRSCR